MISLEEYQIKYAIYEAINSLDIRYDTMELRMLTEMGSREILEEGAKEAIQNFIKKVMSGIQNAWDKFKENVAATKLKWNIEDIKKAVAQYEPKVNVDDYVEFIPEPLSNQELEIRKFDYDSMKDSLDDTKVFMKKYYMSFYKDDSKSIMDNIRSVCTKPKQTGTHAINKSELEKMVTYIDTYEEFKKKIQSDLDNINQGSKSIDFLVQNSIRESVSYSDNRKVALAKTIKYLEDQGLNPNINDKARDRWIKTGDSGEFSGSLCISGLGNNVDKYTAGANKVLKQVGGKLTPDNYGTAFLKVNEIAYVSEDGEGPTNKVSASQEADQEKKNDNQSKEIKTRVENYFKCSSDILSAKLTISREIFLFYSKVLSQHMENNKDKFKSNDDKSNNIQNNNNESNNKDNQPASINI